MLLAIFSVSGDRMSLRPLLLLGSEESLGPLRGGVRSEDDAGARDGEDPESLSEADSGATGSSRSNRREALHATQATSENARQNRIRRENERANTRTPLASAKGKQSRHRKQEARQEVTQSTKTANTRVQLV